ncbi:MAG: DNA methyltransferase, partial [Phycisphaerae bacterium]|nr:DNA methyltransferase [Phycisphaerae bacterium]
MCAKRGRPAGKTPSPPNFAPPPPPPINPADLEVIDRVVQADCTVFLPQYRGPRPRLIFADPPFNIGYQYDRYQDRRPYEEYYNWTVQWMTACANALDPAGSFYVAIGDEYAAEIAMIGKR